MKPDVFRQTEIAVIWDFDKTLIPGLCRRAFVSHMVLTGKPSGEKYKRSGYLQPSRRRIGFRRQHLSKPHSHLCAGWEVSRSEQCPLRELGKELKFYPGLPEFFLQVKDPLVIILCFKDTISAEHYIVSTGPLANDPVQLHLM